VITSFIDIVAVISTVSFYIFGHQNYMAFANHLEGYDFSFFLGH
jgi:hypothetical protein